MQNFKTKTTSAFVLRKTKLNSKVFKYVVKVVLYAVKINKSKQMKLIKYQ